MGKQSCSTKGHCVHPLAKRIIVFSEFNEVKMGRVSRKGPGDHAEGKQRRFLLVGKLWESLLAWTGIAD